MSYLGLRDDVDMTPYKDGPRVFDWNGAARRIAQIRPAVAVAGLREDMGATCGLIWEHDMPQKGNYTYLCSEWATPVLVWATREDIENGVEHVEECWVFKKDSVWNEHTKWPKSALDILKEGA